MKVCLIDKTVGPKAEATVQEAALLTHARADVVLIGAGARKSVSPLLPEGCTWVPVRTPRGRWRRLRLLWSIWRAALHVQADHYHAHTSVPLMALAAAVALLNQGRFWGDFNDIVLLARRATGTRPGRSGGIFDERGHWEAPPSETEQARIEATIQAIPESVTSVLDIGCGDARITNRIAEKIPNIIGLDNSRTALQYVKPPARALLCTATGLPFESQSIDLVLSAEMIEHLPDEAYDTALHEMQRVARRYILIGVPLEEQLACKDIVCPIDGTRFNVNGHMRCFNQGRLKRLFTRFRLVRLIECGAPRRFYYHPLLLWIKQRLGGTWARLPYTICPTCGTNLDATGSRERNAIARWCDRKNASIRQRKKLCRSHVLALYERLERPLSRLTWNRPPTGARETVLSSLGTERDALIALQNQVLGPGR